jgi:23S rRNA (adenine2503-C2)-methyltransferase
MQSLNDLTLEKLPPALAAAGIDVKQYRIEQIFRWTANGISSYDEMTNIPNELKEKLGLHFNFKKVSIKEKFVSKLDGTKKYLMQMQSGHVVESVLMEYKHGFSACVSTQVGCRMGCTFCASTKDGKAGDLSPAEILGQIAAMQKEEGVRVGNVVLMGMGEPLDNYDNVLDFLKIVNDHRGLNLGFRHISVSTCGLADKIYKLAAENLPIALSISLHATEDEVRSRFMPVNRMFNIKELMQAVRFYAKKTGRRISFEYTIIPGENDKEADSLNLAKLLKGLPSHVNLIKLNPIDKNNNIIDDKPAVIFRDRLMKLGINTTIRRTLGSDISASCGQLRGKVKV